MQVENELRPAGDTSSSDAATWLDLWRLVLNGWRWILSGALLGFLAGFLVLQMLPQKWQAIALIQVGQVGQVGQAGSIPVETAAQVVERIGSTNFMVDVARTLKDDEWQEEISGDIRGGEKWVKATVPKNSTRIELKTFGSTPERARQVAEGIVMALAARHEYMAKPTLSRLQNELLVTQEKLSAFDADNKIIGKILAKQPPTDARFSQLALLNSIRTMKENEVFELRQHKVAIETALSEPATQSTRAIEGIYVPSKPVSPKSALVLVLGIACGILLGVGATIVKSR
jgi:uncharacterized protein involved in exopolysaccharide biosynthesis